MPPRQPVVLDTVLRGVTVVGMACFAGFAIAAETGIDRPTLTGQSPATLSRQSGGLSIAPFHASQVRRVPISTMKGIGDLPHDRAFHAPLSLTLSQLKTTMTVDASMSRLDLLQQYGPNMTAAAWIGMPASSGGTVGSFLINSALSYALYEIQYKQEGRIERINRRANGTMAHSAPEMVERARRMAETQAIRDEYWGW